MTDIHELFCANLTFLRNKRGFTQERMSEKLDMDIRSYQKIEYGYKTESHWPNPARLKELARILKCDTVDFFAQ